MLSDPCRAALVPGFYGSDSGYLTRTRTSFIPSSSASTRAGYILWCPSYSNTTGASKPVCLFGFQSGDSTDVPLNTAVAPMFSDSVTTVDPLTGYAAQDSAWAFISNNGSTFRTVAACIQLDFLSRLDGLSGEVCYVDNVPFNTLFPDSGTTGPSVDAIFGMCTTSQRISNKSFEIRYKPTELDELLKTEQQGIVQVGNSSTTSWFGNVGAGVSQPLNMANPGPTPGMIGFAWRGFSASADNILQPRITTYKVVEWQPTRSLGLTAVHTHTRPSQRLKTLTLLDRIEGWTTRAMDAMNEFMADFSQSMRIGGQLNQMHYMGSAGVSMLRGAYGF